MEKQSQKLRNVLFEFQEIDSDAKLQLFIIKNEHYGNRINFEITKINKDYTDFIITQFSKESIEDIITILNLLKNEL